MHPSEDVRAACAAIARRARLVRVDPAALDRIEQGAPPPLDPDVHFVEGAPADVAAYVLTLDAVNFGSGWFHELPGMGYGHVAGALRERWAAGEGWSPADLRRLRSPDVAATLGLPREHRLTVLYTRALRELGRFLADRTALDVIEDAGRSSQRLVATLAGGMAMWRDPGFLKRAQIAASDLALAGVARFEDLDRLTVFADNLLPHVLRLDGVLDVDPALAAHLDAGRTLARGRAERELRAGAVHACALAARRLGMAEHELDNLLWTRGQAARYQDPPPHRTRTVAY